MNASAITIEEAAEALHCSRRRVFELLADGILTRTRSFGRKTLIAVESVQRALEVTPARPERKRRRSPTGFAADAGAAILEGLRPAGRPGQLAVVSGPLGVPDGSGA